MAISEYLNNHNIEIKSFKNSSSKVIDKAISIHFITNDQIINYALPAYPNELFSSVVNKLYEIIKIKKIILYVGVINWI